MKKVCLFALWLFALSFFCVMRMGHGWIGSLPFSFGLMYSWSRWFSFNVLSYILRLLFYLSFSFLYACMMLVCNLSREIFTIYFLKFWIVAKEKLSRKFLVRWVNFYTTSPAPRTHPWWVTNCWPKGPLCCVDALLKCIMGTEIEHEQRDGTEMFWKAPSRRRELLNFVSL